MGDPLRAVHISFAAQHCPKRVTKRRYGKMLNNKVNFFNKIKKKILVFHN